MGAAQAIAVGRNRCGALDIFLIVGVDIREPFLFQSRWRIKDVQTTMPCVAGRHGAIKDAIADTSTSYDVLWVSNAQCMHGKLPWHHLSRTGDDIGEQVAFVIKRPTTVAKTIEANF